MSKGKPITIQQIQNEAMQMLADSFSEIYNHVSTKITYETKDGVYKAACFTEGWTVIKFEDGKSTLLLKDVTEDVMWATLKLLK